MCGFDFAREVLSRHCGRAEGSAQKLEMSRYTRAVQSSRDQKRSSWERHACCLLAHDRVSGGERAATQAATQAQDASSTLHVGGFRDVDRDASLPRLNGARWACFSQSGVLWS